MYNASREDSMIKKESILVIVICLVFLLTDFVLAGLHSYLDDSQPPEQLQSLLVFLEDEGCFLIDSASDPCICLA
ncbi:MAG: hypothetical protein EAX81_06085 [Candidatus Thorarchaeota archaeon]|nr:hypothetical protein [Candidatus Thorarchaeota archaeon]